MVQASKITRKLRSSPRIRQGSGNGAESFSLGSEVRKARKRRDMTLMQLGGRTGLSVSFLSQVERSLLAPSVSALKRIANALRIPAGALMFEADRRSGGTRIGVVRRGERKQITLPASNISYELLTPDMRRRTSILWLYARAGAVSGPAISHEGEDGVIVLKGKLKVEVGGVWYELLTGDSIYFNSELPHRWQNESRRGTEAIWVSCPPSF